jgi:hypothetical protein
MNTEVSRATLLANAAEQLLVIWDDGTLDDQIDYVLDIFRTALAAPEGTALAAMEASKDAAYLERNQVVAALAKAFPSGTARTAIEGWTEDWHGCVYIDLPTGQASWHFHDSQAYLFADLPPYTGEWDGHSTEKKYARLAKLKALPNWLPLHLDAEQAALVRDTIGRDDFEEASPVTIDLLENGPGGPGIYVWLTEYPEEGAICLTDDSSAALIGGSLQPPRFDPVNFGIVTPVDVVQLTDGRAVDLGGKWTMPK